MEARVVFMTAPAGEPAGEIARTLVEERLVACVNIVPGLTSVYSWKGKIEQDSESLLIMKTRADTVGTLKSRALELHPYDTPEFIVVTPEHVEDRYLQWLTESVRTA